MMCFAHRFRDLAGICFGVRRVFTSALGAQNAKYAKIFGSAQGIRRFDGYGKGRREKDMQDIIIALLALYAVWCGAPAKSRA